MAFCCALFFASCEGPQNTPDTYSVQYTDTSVVFTVNGATFTMVKVEGGTFEMGGTPEQGTEDPDSCGRR